MAWYFRRILAIKPIETSFFVVNRFEKVGKTWGYTSHSLFIMDAVWLHIRLKLSSVCGYSSTKLRANLKKTYVTMLLIRLVNSE